jgi:DNA-binding NarL/FixJ family response regulator
VERYQVLLVDDFPVIRLGLTQLINQQPDLVVCGEAATLQEGIEAAMRLRPHIVLVDLSPPQGGLLHLLQTFRTRLPELPLLVFTAYDETVYALRALQARARGYVSKSVEPALLLAAVRRVLRGEIVASERITARLIQASVAGHALAESSPLERLSNREVEVLHYIAQGYSMQQIASLLHVSAKTIESHRAHIMNKLYLANARELLLYAVRWLYGIDTGPLPGVGAGGGCLQRQ